MTAATPPPSWYPDPANAAYVRYWDGSVWTEHTQPVPQSNPGQPAISQSPTVDEHGDVILFQERTVGSAKTLVTLTANRFTAGKRSIALSDVTGITSDVTQIVALGIKSGVSFEIGLKGDGVKPVAIITQNLPLRSGGDNADRQFSVLIDLFETHLVPQLLQRLHHRVMNGMPVDIVGAELTPQGITMKRKSISWDQYCGAREDGRAVSILGPTPDAVVGTTYVSFVNVRLLARLCDLCAGR
jgi:hypothetical protein